MEGRKSKRTPSASSSKGMKLKTLPITEKLKVIDRTESRLSMHVVCEEFGIKKSTYYDFKNKNKKSAHDRRMEKPKKGENTKKRKSVFKCEEYSCLNGTVHNALLNFFNS